MSDAPVHENPVQICLFVGALTAIMMYRGFFHAKGAQGIRLSPEDMQGISEHVRIAGDFLTQNGFQGSHRLLLDVGKTFLNSQGGVIHSPIACTKLDALILSVVHELGDRGIFVMSSDETRCLLTDFTKIELFFASRSETIPWDVREASKCIAFSLGTASVFHAMRAVEASVELMRQKLGITSSAAMLGPKLDEIEKAIKSMPRGSEKDAWSQLNAYLYSIKDAWRNPTMHPKNFYDLDEAKAIFDNVMRLLSKVAIAIA